MRNYDAGHVSFVMGSMVNVVSFFIFFVFVFKKRICMTTTTHFCKFHINVGCIYTDTHTNNVMTNIANVIINKHRRVMLR